ncbi:MAG: hypothetical protein GX804_08315 [Lentisphaerae bacterium]|jgi:hypothetical protein|nr:hypothetical protein [Lentisphaerota bacterium]
MKLTKHINVILTSVIMMSLATAGAQTVLYADDFNRGDGVTAYNVGKTSVGNYTWVDPGWHNFKVIDNVLHAVHWSSPSNQYAYVDYDLSTIPDYDASLRLTTGNTREAGSSAGLFLLPRAVNHDTVLGNRGWVVNRNFWDPSGSEDQVRFYWYEGADTNEFASIPATRIDDNQFSATEWQNIEIRVRGDKATLIVSQADGTRLVDADRYIGNYNTTKSVFLFAARTSAGQNKAHRVKAWLNVTMDDFSVSLLPPTVIILK